MKLKTLFVATTVAMGALLSATAQAETLKIGVEAMYPPYEYKDASGKLMGFDVDLADAVCAKMNVTCEWVESSFDGLIPALNARKFDFINSTMNITEQRKKVINFTQPIYQSPSQLVVKSDVNVDLSADSLLKNNVTVSVLQGSAQETYAKKHWQSKGVKVISYGNQDQAFVDLLNGRVASTFLNTPVAKETFLNKPEAKNFKIVDEFAKDEAILGEGIAFGVRKDDDKLKKRLDEALQALKEEGVILSLIHI